MVIYKQSPRHHGLTQVTLKRHETGELNWLSPRYRGTEFPDLPKTATRGALSTESSPTHKGDAASPQIERYETGLVYGAQPAVPPCASSTHSEVPQASSARSTAPHDICQS